MPTAAKYGASVELTEETHTDLGYLRAATDLLQRVRNAHPTSGVWEAADLQWWWRRQRSSDCLPQLFWRDSQTGHFVGAATRTDWRGRMALDIVAMPHTNDETLELFWSRGLELVSTTRDVDVFVDTTDKIAQRSLIGAGFVDIGELGTSAWLGGALIGTAHLPDGYRLVSRADQGSSSHHLDSERNGFDVRARLEQTSLYRPDLDLRVIDQSGEVCAYGLFWYDPETRVGLVEPMGTIVGHRRRGLARHLLEEGISRLQEAGTTRVKINYENDNEASKKLYRDTGFQPATVASGFTRSEPTGHE